MAIGRKTGGRVAGTPNKFNSDLRGMIMTALDQAGGVDYLAQRAIDTPGPFLALVGKVLPSQLTTDDATSVVLLHLAAARAMSAQLIDGQVEPAPQEQQSLLDAPTPTE